MPRTAVGRVASTESATEPATGSAVELPIHRMPGHIVRRLQQVHVSLFAQAVKDRDLTTVQYAALVAVNSTPGIDQASLAGLIGFDRATIGGVVERLEAKGWLKRTSDAADRRVRRLSVTAAGAAVVREVTPAVERVQAQLLEGLAPEEQRAFERLARKILAHHLG